VKRCPTCNKTFTEERLSFCIDDGTPLVPVVESRDDEATVVRSTGENDSTGTARSSGAASERTSTPYQAPASYVPPGAYGGSQRRVWPWVLGIFAILFVLFVGLGIAAVVLAPRLMRASNINTNLNANVERRTNSNANTDIANSNSNLNSNANSPDWNANTSNADDTTPPPTDDVEVLSDLTNIEHEWTMANINADKKKLEQILADDYVSIVDGKDQGKVDYLKRIKRDTSIQKWNFEDLKVSLRSDRATLTGTIRLEVTNQQGEIQPEAFRFTDKFVWRDGRWQATGSVVEQLQE
jgi:hypothetical protein